MVGNFLNDSLRVPPVTRLDERGLRNLVASIEHDVERELYDGGVIIAAHKGEIALRQAIGYSHRDTGRKTQLDDIFHIFSTTKTFTNALVLKAFDRGLLSPITKVVDIIPEFAGLSPFARAPKEKVSILHLFTHRGALAQTPWPVPPLEAGNFADTIAAICEMPLVGEPGEKVYYSPCLSHALLGEIARRTLGEGRSFTQMLHDELLDPLGMTDTSMGMRADREDRRVPVVPRLPQGEFFSPSDITDTADAAWEGAEMPWVGCLSTADDIFTFTEMLRRGGELNGERILSPSAIAMATTLQTGTLVNERYANIVHRMHWEPWTANIGLGFMMRGYGMHQTFFGLTASPRTFGGYGAGSSQFWIDPERDLTFVFLSAGVLGERDNLERFQRLSDLTISAAV